MKKCNKCGIEKPLSVFNKNKANKDGLSYKCNECDKKQSKGYKKNNPNYMREWHEVNPNYNMNYYQNNLNYFKEKNKEYREKTPEFWIEYWKEYNKKYKENNPNYCKEYKKIRRKNDPIYKLTEGIRSNMSNSFKRACNGKYSKTTKTIEMLGCDFEYFIQYIQSQFTEGMTLDNYGEWELDHKIPISSAKTEEDVIRLNNYTNFQPLWWWENVKKGDKFL
jgi:hypothetical protein